MNPLPPQAYTQDTVNAAYQWLTKQPQSIREMASSLDMLVHLYLKAKRHGDEALERPSIQNFTKELKSLAGMMGDFEPQQPAFQTITQAPAVAAPQAPAQIKAQAPAPATAASATTTSAPPNASTILDAKSTEMIQKVKETFNLSSNAEVLRLLISTGYHHVMKLKDT
jgi:hypothetical protein